MSKESSSEGTGCLLLILVISLAITTCSTSKKVDDLSSDSKIIINQNKILETQLIDLDKDLKRLDSAFNEYKKQH